MKKLTTLIIAVLMTGSIMAGGFQTNTQNARAMGMGSAFVGMALDASSIYFNPAGLTNIKGFSFTGGTTLLLPSIDHTGFAPMLTKTSTVQRVFTPINIYAAYGMNNGFSFGIGVYNPYGSGTEWPSNWVGKRLAVKTELKTFYITPTVAYKINKNFSIGAGFSYIISDVLFTQAADIPAIPLAPGVSLPAAKDVGISLAGTGKAAYSFSLGLMYKSDENYSVGLLYRHSAKIDYDGDLTFSGLPAKPTGFPIGHSDLFPDGKGTASITMPWDFRIGFSYDPTPNFTVNADAMWVGWESYNELAADFEKNTAAWADLKSPKKWSNSLGFKLGGEYRVGDLALRAGYVYDATPIPTYYMDPSMPGSDRNEYTVGVGYKISSNFRIDFAYQYLSFDIDIKDSKIPFNGNYVNQTNLFGLNFGYSL